jgi:cysteinyl-tRNA synthetase
MVDVLGIPLREEAATVGSDAAPFIELLIETRTLLRKERQFALADQLRDKLRDLGVALEDSPNGTTWRLERGAPSASS